MFEVNFGSQSLFICDTLEEIKITNKEEASQYASIDLSFNPDLSKLGEGLQKAIKYVESAKPEDAINILQNLYGGIIYTERNNIPIDMAFYCLIKGVEDLHESVINEKMREYKTQGLSYSMIRDSVSRALAGFSSEMKLNHSSLLGESPLSMYSEAKKRLSIEMINNSLDENEENAKALDNAYSWLLSVTAPQNLAVLKNNPLTIRKKNFANTLRVLSGHIGFDASQLKSSLFYGYLEGYLTTVNSGNN